MLAGRTPRLRLRNGFDAGLDETLEHKLSHKTTRGLKRADTSMTHMIQDDEARLRTLEAAQVHGRWVYTD